MARRRWSSEEKIRIVLESLNTNIGIAELCRKHSVSPVVFYHWREKFMEGGKMALSCSLKNGMNREQEAEVERLKKLIGELTIANDAFKKTLEGRRR